MTKIKFCGMMRPEDVGFANAIHPDYVGVVFAPGRKRTITYKTAKKLKSSLNPDICCTGVFVNEEVSRILSIMEKGIIDACQLHGNEDEHYIRALKGAGTKQVIKAFRIQSTGDLKRAYDCCADEILLDAGYGDGKTFDWDLLAGFDRPFFLAGGLDPVNVRDAITRLHPYGVDVSSGIETDGKKSQIKMSAFAQAVRAQELE